MDISILRYRPSGSKKSHRTPQSVKLVSRLQFEPMQTKTQSRTADQGNTVMTIH
jgi:hypothetical protein